MITRFLSRVRYSLSVIAHIFRMGEVDKHCPCCDYYGRFDTLGEPPRYGCLCPNCGSLERHRLLVLSDQLEDFFTGKEVLHFAPEAILSRLIRVRAKRYVTADIIAGRADCILNIEKINQPSNSWDLVVCFHVLEHVNDFSALAELHRILRHRALLLIMVPIIEGCKTYENPDIILPQDRAEHFGQFDHIRYYGHDLRDRLKETGFTIREYTACGSDVVKYGLLRGEKLFICTKITE